MSTILTVTGKRAYKHSDTEPLSVSASVNFVADNKLNREGIFALRSACSAQIDSIVLSVDKINVAITRTAKQWEWEFDGKQETRKFCETLNPPAKAKGLALSDATRDHRVDLYEVVTQIVRDHFKEIAPVARRGGGGKGSATKAVLKSQLNALKSALAAAGKSDEEIAALLSAAAVSDDKSQNDARQNAHKEPGKVTAADVPSKK